METSVKVKGDATVRIFPDPTALSHGAAGLFLTLAQEAIIRHGQFAVALSGGSTPKELYTLLGAKPYRERIDWQRVHVFWSDERCVPPDQSDSNFRMAHQALLSRVELPEKNIHRIKGEEGAGPAAAAYERELNAFFGGKGFPELDLVLLGVGEDGHTASLFPGAPEVAERDRWAVPVYPGQGKKDRVTLTLPIINHAKHVMFLAAGQSKREVIRSLLGEGNPDNLPAGLVKPDAGTVVWYIDEAAAELFKR